MIRGGQMGEGLYRVIYSPEVYEQIREICSFIAEDSPQNARLVAQRLTRGIDSLQFMPGRFAEVDYTSFPTPARRMIVWPFRVLYRIDENRKAVRILRVEHGSRDTK